jgi:succinate dehydrogenase / fumarate reductase membrane anchor subunit
MSWRAQGLRAWLLQRLTAIYMAFYLLLALIILCYQSPSGFTAWHDLFRQPVINVATVFMFASIFYLAWVGVRDILVDYVHPQPVRFTILSLVSLLLLALMLWVVFLMFGVLQG